MRLSTSLYTAGFCRRFGFEVDNVQTGWLASGLDAVEMSLDLAGAAAV